MLEVMLAFGKGSMALMTIMGCLSIFMVLFFLRTKLKDSSELKRRIAEFEQAFNRKYVDEKGGLERLRLVADIDYEIHVAAVAAASAFEREHDSNYPTNSAEHKFLQATSAQMRSEFWRKFNAASPMDMPLRWKRKGISTYIYFASASMMSDPQSFGGQSQDFETKIKLYVLQLSIGEYRILRGEINRDIPSTEYVFNDENPLHEPVESPADKVRV